MRSNVYEVEMNLKDVSRLLSHQQVSWVCWRNCTNRNRSQEMFLHVFEQ